MITDYFILNKCCEIGLKLNASKCIFKSSQVLFYGHLVSNVGLKADPKKIESIVHMPIPQNKTQLQSFIGLCNYLTFYVPHLTDVLALLRTLTDKTNEFQWGQEHTDALESAKSVISRSSTLQYFTSEDPIVIQVDASSIGVGSALMQHN